MSRILVPLIVAALAVGLFLWTREDSGPVLDVPTDVRDCTANLQAIFDGLLDYRDLHGALPEASGPELLASLVGEGLWTADDETARRLTCPGPGAEPVSPGTDWTRPESLGPRSSAYAARDLRAHPLERFPVGGREARALVACDNASGSNHAGVINVLYSDRTVKSFEYELLREKGLLAATAAHVTVGPDSALEELRALVP